MNPNAAHTALEIELATINNLIGTKTQISLKSEERKVD
jgi:hypothetical protein